MKSRSIRLMFFAAVVTFLSSCSEESNIIPGDDTTSNVRDVDSEMFRTVSEEGEVVNYRYYLDEKEVYEPFDMESGDFHIVVTTEPSEDKTEGVFKIWGFTSKQGLYEFGTKHGGDFEKAIKYESHMKAYAEESGAIQIYEETGEAPEWYMAYEEQYYNEVFGSKSPTGGRVESFTSLYEHVWRQGRHNLMYQFAPFMIWGWNNTVSSYESWHIGGVVSMYDRSFYRNHFFYLWDWGWKVVNFNGPMSFANDRMSSGFSFGI